MRSRNEHLNSFITCFIIYQKLPQAKMSLIIVGNWFVHWCLSIQRIHKWLIRDSNIDLYYTQPDSNIFHFLHILWSGNSEDYQFPTSLPFATATRRPLLICSPFKIGVLRAIGLHAATFDEYHFHIYSGICK